MCHSEARFYNLHLADLGDDTASAGVDCEARADSRSRRTHGSAPRARSGDGILFPLRYVKVQKN